MSTDVEAEGNIRSVNDLSDALVTDLVALGRSRSTEAWNRSTNCPPWRVRDLATHVVVSGAGFAASVRQGLAGSVEPAAPNEARARQEAVLMGAGPSEVAGALTAVTEEFVELYRGRSPEALDAPCYHRRGNRSARWYAAHRLAELAFHSWDLQFSLGRTPHLDPEVASRLLPTLVEVNAPRTYAAGLAAERGIGERFGLVVAGDPAARWVVTIGPDQLQVGRGDAPADLTITGPAETLALLVYGRGDLVAGSAAGLLHLDGDTALTERFARIFPRP